MRLSTSNPAAIQPSLGLKVRSNQPIPSQKLSAETLLSLGFEALRSNGCIGSLAPRASEVIPCLRSIRQPSWWESLAPAFVARRLGCRLAVPGRSE